MLGWRGVGRVWLHVLPLAGQGWGWEVGVGPGRGRLGAPAPTHMPHTHICRPTHAFTPTHASTHALLPIPPPQTLR